MEIGKEYPVTEDIKKLFDEHHACDELGKQRVNRIFTWRRAAYFKKKSERAERQAWTAIHHLYPQLKTDQSCVYLQQKGVFYLTVGRQSKPIGGH